MGDAAARDRSRERDRSRRGDRPTRFSDGGRDRSRERGNERDRKRGSNRRVYVSNICYEYRWQDLKDLFRTHVGDVSFVEIFVDEKEKPKGCGIVEFADDKSVKKCLDVMHRFELKGRKLVVREDFDNERDKYGNIINRRGDRDRDNLPDLRDEMRMERSDNLPSLLNMSGPGGPGGAGDKWGNTYGLSPEFLESLDITGPLLHRVFVANLDYKVDEKKLKEVFKLAGRVISVELNRDKDGNSRGFGVVEYDHPVESVQAISMFHGQQLYDRKLIARMDRDRNDGPIKLPDGLKTIGMGLGANGDPLRDISRNLPSNSGSNNDGCMSSGNGILGAMPSQALHNLGSGLGGVGGLNGVVSNNLAGLVSSQAAALQASLASAGSLSNPILASSLVNSGNEFGLGGLGNSGLNASLVSNSLQNASLVASLANNMNNQGLGANVSHGGGGGNMSGNMNTGNYQRHDSGNNFHQNSSNAYNNSSGGQDRMSNRDSFMDNRDYDPLPSNMNSRNYMKQDDNDDFRSPSLYSTVNNGSQGRNFSQGSDWVSDTVVVSNLPPSATWTMLRDKFRTFGEIKFCEMKGTDVGIIRFAEQRSAKESVEMMDRARVEGRTIDVRFL